MERPSCAEAVGLVCHDLNRVAAEITALQNAKPDVLQKTILLRRTLVQMKPVEAMEQLVKQLAKSPSNAAFLERMTAVVK